RYPGAALCSAGSLGSVPLLLGSYCGTPTPRLPASLGLSLHSAVPTSRRERGLPGSWTTLAYVPWSCTPVGHPVRGPGPSTCVLDEMLWPATTVIVSAPRSQSFEADIPRLACPLSTLRSRPHERTTQDSLPAGGLRPWPGATLTRGSLRSVWCRYITSAKP